MSRPLFLVAAITFLLGCSPTPSTSASGEGSPTTIPHQLASDHLANLVQVHPRVLSGGVPANDEAFAELQRLGVKTIISVDGDKPDIAAAKRQGLRYVHLPHGYDGIPEDRVQQLAKAVRDLEGPIYLHCHHGKHRSPAAASAACIASGMLSASQGVRVLRLAGTSPNYRGLFASVESTKSLAQELLDAMPEDFPEIGKIPPLAEAMVAIQQTHDHLKSIADAGWQTPADHPDLDPAHEALLLGEHFTELLRTETEVLRTADVQQDSAGFQHLLKDSAAAAQALEAILRRREGVTRGPANSSLDSYALRINANCKACHQKYRDVPLGRK